MCEYNYYKYTFSITSISYISKDVLLLEVYIVGSDIFLVYVFVSPARHIYSTSICKRHKVHKNQEFLINNEIQTKIHYVPVYQTLPDQCFTRVFWRPPAS